jgi:hypothetical protein
VVRHDVVELTGDGQALELSGGVEAPAAVTVDRAQVQPRPRGHDGDEHGGDDEQGQVRPLTAAAHHAGHRRARHAGDDDRSGCRERAERPAREECQPADLGHPRQGPVRPELLPAGLLRDHHGDGDADDAGRDAGEQQPAGAEHHGHADQCAARERSRVDVAVGDADTHVEDEQDRHRERGGRDRQGADHLRAAAQEVHPPRAYGPLDDVASADRPSPGPRRRGATRARAGRLSTLSDAPEDRA